jgi:hypothetical protein
MRQSIVIAFASLASLGGCASLSKDECLTADWRTIGYQDGARGALADTVGSHRKACAKHGVAPNLEAYLYGRNEGLRSYCHPQRGYSLGAGGGVYQGVCPVDLERPFLAAYNDGHGLYVRREAVRSLESALAYNERRAEEIVHLILAKEVDLIAPDATVEERAHLLIDIKNLAAERETLVREIPALVQRRDAAARDLAAYEQRLATAAL